MFVNIAGKNDLIVKICAIGCGSSHLNEIIQNSRREHGRVIAGFAVDCLPYSSLYIGSLKLASKSAAWLWEYRHCPDSNVHGANMGPTWVLFCYQGGGAGRCRGDSFNAYSWPKTSRWQNGYCSAGLAFTKSPKGKGLGNRYKVPETSDISSPVLCYL